MDATCTRVSGVYDGPKGPFMCTLDIGLWADVDWGQPSRAVTSLTKGGNEVTPLDEGLT